jgi:hypothetical protein
MIIDPQQVSTVDDAALGKTKRVQPRDDAPLVCVEGARWEAFREEACQQLAHVAVSLCCSYHHRCLSCVLYCCVPKLRTHWTKFYCFFDRSVREKAWRSRKRVAQAT